MNRRSFLGSILAAAAAPAIVKAEALMRLAPQRVVVPADALLGWNAGGDALVFVKQFERNFALLAQQRGSRLYQWVEVGRRIDNARTV